MLDRSSFTFAFHKTCENPQFWIFYFSGQSTVVKITMPMRRAHLSFKLNYQNAFLNLTGSTRNPKAHFELGQSILCKPIWNMLAQRLLTRPSNLESEKAEESEFKRSCLTRFEVRKKTFCFCPLVHARRGSMLIHFLEIAGPQSLRKLWAVHILKQ